MNYSISVDAVNCIRCGKCAKVCPSKIFEQHEANSEITVVNPQNCIACGHCVCACPADSVAHSLFPAEKLQEIDYSALPSPEQFLLLCHTRRSNRAFSIAPIPKESLDMIVEAAKTAPTASNLQGVRFMMITDPDKLRLVSDFTLNTFDNILKKLTMPVIGAIIQKMMPHVVRYIPVFNRMKKEYQKGNDMILRKATAMLIIYAPEKSNFGAEDCNLAYQNASLMTEALGISQFYTGFVLSATKQKPGALEKTLGVNGKIYAGAALANPLFRFKKYVIR